MIRAHSSALEVTSLANGFQTKRTSEVGCWAYQNSADEVPYYKSQEN
jgi:hypothetical protein